MRKRTAFYTSRRKKELRVRQRTRPVEHKTLQRPPRHPTRRSRRQTQLEHDRGIISNE